MLLLLVAESRNIQYNETESSYDSLNLQQLETHSTGIGPLATKHLGTYFGNSRYFTGHRVKRQAKLYRSATQVLRQMDSPHRSHSYPSGMSNRLLLVKTRMVAPQTSHRGRCRCRGLCRLLLTLYAIFYFSSVTRLTTDRNPMNLSSHHH
jgi:hypothetical protein